MSAMDEDPFDPFELYFCSLQRCTADPDFMLSFYERFLASSDAVKQMFVGVDLVKQRLMLGTALTTMAGLQTLSPNDVDQLEKIARVHGPNGLNIAPAMYDTFVDTMIDTVRATDPEFDDQVKDAWRSVLRRGVDFFIEHG